MAPPAVGLREKVAELPVRVAEGVAEALPGREAVAVGDGVPVRLMV